MKLKIAVFSLALLLVLGVSLVAAKNVTKSQTTDSSIDGKLTSAGDTAEGEAQSDSVTNIKMLKDVGEAYLFRFGLDEADFKSMRDAKINLIEGNFDICAEDSEVTYFLDMSQRFGMKVILPAGAGEAEWGYTCNQNSYPISQKPVWDKTAVQIWVNKWKNHTALYGWDTSNEAGSVFPNSSQEYYLTTEQLQRAYQDVKEADNVHPILIRQNGWFYYDNNSDFFRKGNPFAKDIADIVMVNAYSNVEEYFRDFVSTVLTRAIFNLKYVDPDIKVIASLGAWEEKPLWVKPSINHLKHDLDQVNAKNEIMGVAYFKYGARGSSWYLPTSASQIWQFISKN